MADGLIDKVKFTGNRIGQGNVTDLVRVAPYRLPADVKGLGDRVFLEVKKATDDTVWEHAWFELASGGQLELYQVVDTHQRSGEYDPENPPSPIEFDGPVEVGAIAN